jgi:hypothetical protein
LKQALKEAREWVKDALPGGQAPEGSLRSRSEPAKLDRGSGTDPPAVDPETEATAQALRQRVELAAPVAETPRGHADVDAARALIPNFIQSVRDMLLHPATWLLLALALMLKFALAFATLRSRRSSMKRQRAASRASPGPAVDAAPQASGLLAPSGQQRRRPARHGQRHHREQR